MHPWIRLIRLPNLLIVALTQLLLYYRILIPAYYSSGITAEMSSSAFFLLCLITVLITAGGYIINDIYDQESDAINKPDRRVVGLSISESTAYRVYLGIGILGMALSALLALHLGKLPYLVLFPLAFTLLHYYTTNAQGKVLWGNLLIAVFCAGVAGVLWLAEIRSLRALALASPSVFEKVQAIFFWYAVFALFINGYREVVKDLEDMEGDARVGIKSLPVVYGQRIAVNIARAIAGILLLFLVFQARHLHLRFGLLLPGFLGIAVFLPLAYSAEMLKRAKAPRHYRSVSHFIKFVILSGVLSLFLVQPG